jgi:hypothetical protein
VYVKLSDFTPEQWYQRLNTRRMTQAKQAHKWWQYIDLEQPLVYVARILAEQDNRFPPLLLSWPDLVISSVNERLKMESFLLADEQPADDLNALWKANDLDELSGEAQYAAMTSGQHFVMVGPGDDDTPLITFEYEDQVAVETDPRSRQPKVGLKVWAEDEDLGSDVLAALYVGLDDSQNRRVYEFRNGEVESGQPIGAWMDQVAADPRMPSVPFVPMRNRPRKGAGRSDLVAVKPYVDGANQFATNLMAAGESHAVARKWAVGVSEKDFVDENGKQIPAWSAAMRAVWAVPNPEPQHRGEQVAEVKLGQFTASDLNNFHSSLKTLATFVASHYGMPPGYMGYSSDNPPSAESILYSLERLVLRSEDRQGWDGSAYKKANRIAWAIMQRDPTQIREHEAKWRNAATPTLASKMDAAVKGVGGGIIDPEQAWIDLGYSEQTKKGLRQRMAARAGQVANDLNTLDQIPATLPDLPAVNGAPALSV